MIDISKIDYSKFDRPEILMFLFHPRSEWRSSEGTGRFDDILIPVEEGVEVGARFHRAEKGAANILFFHGNGEIVADYDDMGHLYTQMGINFSPVDYRGYGKSTGRPTITAMMRDCHVIFDHVKEWLSGNSYDGPLIVMGRSLGSASALELCSQYGSQIAGLIIESGFAYLAPLLALLGINTEILGLKEDEGLRNIEKIHAFHKPTLIIHAEYDHIIPYPEGQALYDASPAEDKRILMIPGANHNDIFLHGMQDYMEAIGGLVNKASRPIGPGFALAP
ncbi:MAG: alpha/beta hydrolase [Pseudomonadota bacterium]